MSQQIIATAAMLLFLVFIMSIGMIVKGRPMRRSCGGLGGADKSDCLICDGGDEPENCPK